WNAAAATAAPPMNRRREILPRPKTALSRRVCLEVFMGFLDIFGQPNFQTRRIFTTLAMKCADASSGASRHDAVVVQRREHTAVASRDLPRFLIKQQRQTQAFGHFCQAKHGLPAYCQIDMGKRLAPG